MSSISISAELRKRTTDYFVSIQSKPTGNIKLYVKALVLILSFILFYTHVVFLTSNHTLVSLMECMILGALTSAIGFNIMHDGAHGSFSKKKIFNDLAGISLNVLGANVFLWKTKHNIVHHTYTNIEGMDDDIDLKPFLRLCNTQKRYGIHRFQHLYFWMAYSLFYFFWVFFSDYNKYFSRKVGDIKISNITTLEHLSFWVFKILHLILFIIIPIYSCGLFAWSIGFLTYGLFAGIVLSLVFQLAHTVQSTHFPSLNIKTGRVEDEWAIHQLKTTSNFATRNKLISWFTGGLNFQIEHHLFPYISHIHYPAISQIVKQVCKEYNVTYNEYPKMRLALVSHILHLKQMGRA